MRHRVKKIRFKKGRDATKATLRRLALNFIKKGRIKTTWPKIKILKSYIDRLTSKAKKKNQAAKNVLLRELGDKKIINQLFDLIVPHFNNREGGFVKVIRLGRRLGDGAEMGRMEWVEPIMKAKNLKVKEKNKQKEDGKTNQNNQGAKKSSDN